MAFFSDYLEQKVLEYVFRGQAYTPASTLYVALYTTLPNDADSGGTEVSTSGTAYARLNLGTLSSAFSAWTIANGIKNVNALTWSQATANWGTLVGAAIRDASSGGNLLCFGAFNASRVVNSGDIFSIGANDLTITLD